jgi:putative FmdB family regulatory protein
MPTYAYKCTVCGTSFDVVQSFSDASLTVHEGCGGALRKLFSPVGVTFNGSGFYRTDSRSKPASGSSDSGSSSGSGSTTSSGSSSGSGSSGSGSGSSSGTSSSGSSSSAPASAGASS